MARHIRHVELTARTGSSSVSEDVNWDFVWKLKLPNKVKVFFWCLLNLALPVLVNLHNRKIVNNLNYPVSNCGIEYVLHLFTECHYARIFWALSSVSNLIYVPATGSVWEWVMAVREAMTPAGFEFFVCSCWHIWANRNKIIHEG